MPGAGKSTVGVILAKRLSFGFIDTDILIQIRQRAKLQNIIDEFGYMRFREIEEREVLKLNVDHHVIATGGSVIYSEKAMAHLKTISWIVFLNSGLPALRSRIHNFDSRGIAMKEGRTLEDIFVERQLLYPKYADFTLNCDTMDQETAAGMIGARWLETITEESRPHCG